MKKLDIVIFGLSITSSWGNGHATTYRSLVKALARRGHRMTFFEKDVSWYSNNRDLADPPFCRTILYGGIEELSEYEDIVAQADLVILGSYVADAEKCCRMISELKPACFAFYDIDTPVTLMKLERSDYEYLHPWMIPVFDMYLSFTGGPILEELETKYEAQKARPLYCSVDPELYYPDATSDSFDQEERLDITMGYLGTYSRDRQPTVEELLLKPARQLPTERFIVAGAQYPESISWPANVETIHHIPPKEHKDFYNAQRFTLNVTRQDMIRAGYSPSVRLFEAGACGTPVISDFWEGLDSFFRLEEEILVARNGSDVLTYLQMPPEMRRKIGRRFRERVLSEHTSSHRAAQVEQYWLEATEAPVQGLPEKQFSGASLRS